MFRIKEVTLYSGTDSKKYRLSDNTYIYGNNNVGKDGRQRNERYSCRGSKDVGLRFGQSDMLGRGSVGGV